MPDITYLREDLLRSRPILSQEIVNELRLKGHPKGSGLGGSMEIRVTKEPSAIDRITSTLVLRDRSPLRV